MRHGDRHRHVARGSEMSGGGWLVAGVGNFQVGGNLWQERRWGDGARERVYDDKRY